MASNPNVNKVQFGGQTIMDITDTTATESDVVSGRVFYKASGARAVGSVSIPQPATATPLQDSVGAVGTSTKYAREDHVHPAVGVKDNVLINAYFAGGGSQQDGGQFPINQRGLTTYTGAVYSIDCWKGGAGAKVTFPNTKDCIRLTRTANSCELKQTLEQSINAQMTASMLVKGNFSAGTWRLNILDSQGTAVATAGLSSTASGTVRLITVTWTPTDYPIKGVSISASSNIGTNEYLDVYAIKLELGPVQTLAHLEGTTWVLNAPPPNFQQELAKCQRYCVMLKPNSTYPIFGFGQAASGTVFIALIPVPVPMAVAKPTITTTGSFNLYSGGSGTGVSLTFPTKANLVLPAMVEIALTVSGLTDEKFYRLCAANDTTASILLEANPT